MQDILLPLLVINFLLTFWLIRQRILRQGRRHRRREELAEWRSHIDLRIKQHFETLVNQSEIFVEHRSAMAEINKDHYALNERLDGISVYDIKAILAGQERIQALESDIEAIKKDKSTDHTLISLERRASKIELALDSIETTIDDFGRRLNTFGLISKGHTEWADKVDRYMEATKEVQANNSDWISKLDYKANRVEELVFNNVEVTNRWMDEVNGEISVLKNNFSGDDATISNLRNDHEMLSATVETLRIQHSGLASKVSNWIANNARRICSMEEWLTRHTKFPFEGDDVALVFNDTIIKIDADIMMAKNELDAVRSRIDALEKAQIKDDEWQLLQRVYEGLDNRIVDLENGAKPFNPDTLIDSILSPDRKVARGTILLSGDDIVKYGDEICFDPSFDWEESINSSVGKTVSEVSASIGHTVMVRRTLTPAEDQSPESDRQEDKAYDQLLDKAVKNARPKKQKPGTDYTHDIIP